MQYKLFTSAVFASVALAATIPASTWETLTPSVTLEDGTTDYDTTFGIQIKTISEASSSTVAAAKRLVRRDASQIDDGQVQATTGTETTAAEVVSQIGDGQIQATTATAAEVVSQIGDGQIQATTATAAQVVSQIGDGQIQATTATTAGVVSQIGDGQVQATTSTAAGASQISDGQVQATATTSADDSTESSDSTDDDDTTIPSSCIGTSSLAMVLNGGILTDSKGRIGSIVANRQFQFDGPPPQAGAIYAAGWAISEDGYLAIGNTTTFYQCLSGTFYNLYDESIGGQCHPVHLSIVNLVEC